MKSRFLILLLTTSFLVVACQNYKKEASSEDQITITDMVGRNVSFDRNSIKRVVCIGAGALRLYSYIGDINLIVGVEDIDRNVNQNRFAGASRPYYDANVEYFSTLPSVGLGGPAAQAAEPEKIINVDPDLIISEYEDVKKADDLQQQLNVPVLVTSYGGANVFSEQVKGSITMLGNALNKEEKAAALNKYISDCKNELQEKVKDVDEENAPSMYVGCLGNWGKQGFTTTSKQYPPFNVSKIKNVASSLLNENQGPVELEKIIEANPDKVIIDAAGAEIFKEAYKADSTTYQAIDAIKNGEMYLQMAFNAYYTNLEIALMNCYYIASIAYPSLYEGFDIATKSNEITKAFLGKEMYDSSIKNMKYSYGGYQKISDMATFGE